MAHWKNLGGEGLHSPHLPFWQLCKFRSICLITIIQTSYNNYICFIDTRNEVIAALEHREATLLCLLDKQVELREQILQEQRMEVAAALSRAIAAKEEGKLSLHCI